ncbi:MAG: hypothetical protein GY855_07775 [candidate division Zixibacteria bacterium]|nr:hypothetical protein [candidate division Zixibacteria bacterium]
MDRIGVFFVKNLPLKIGAVIFAALLWFHTVTEKTYEYNFEVTRSQIQLPEGYTLIDDTIPNIEIKLTGKGKSLLECFDPNALLLDVDLTGYNAGSFEFPVDAQNIILPKSERLAITEVIFPKFIHLHLIKKD